MPYIDEPETLVQSRRLADAIVKELERTLPRPIAVPPSVAPAEGAAAPRIEPEELLPPPPSLPPSNIFETTWSATMPLAVSPAATRTPRKKRRARSHLHWAVLAMGVAIAVGLWRDPVARANAKRSLLVETSRIVKVVAARVG